MEIFFPFKDASSIAEQDRFKLKTIRKISGYSKAVWDLASFHYEYHRVSMDIIGFLRILLRIEK